MFDRCSVQVYTFFDLAASKRNQPAGCESSYYVDVIAWKFLKSPILLTSGIKAATVAKQYNGIV